MTTWPSSTKASTANVDSGYDKPRLARPDIKQNIDNVNDIIDYFDGGGSITATGDQISFNKGYKETINTLTSSASITVDADTASVHKVILDTNATFTLSNMTTGQSVSIIVVQDGTGTRTGAFSGVKFPSGVVNSLSTGANDIDIVNIFYDGTNYYGSVLRDFV